MQLAYIHYVYICQLMTCKTLLPLLKSKAISGKLEAALTRCTIAVNETLWARMKPMGLARKWP